MSYIYHSYLEQDVTDKTKTPPNPPQGQFTSPTLNVNHGYANHTFQHQHPIRHIHIPQLQSQLQPINYNHLNYFGYSGPATNSIINSQAEVPHKPVRKRAFSKRSKTGCLTCRARRIKCDECKPICKNCAKSNRCCNFPDPNEIGKKKKQKKTKVSKPKINTEETTRINDANSQTTVSNLSTLKTSLLHDLTSSDLINTNGVLEPQKISNFNFGYPSFHQHTGSSTDRATYLPPPIHYTPAATLPPLNNTSATNGTATTETILTPNNFMYHNYSDSLSNISFTPSGLDHIASNPNNFISTPIEKTGFNFENQSLSHIINPSRSNRNSTVSNYKNDQEHHDSVTSISSSQTSNNNPSGYTSTSSSFSLDTNHILYQEYRGTGKPVCPNIYHNVNNYNLNTPPLSSSNASTPTQSFWPQTTQYTTNK